MSEIITVDNQSAPPQKASTQNHPALHLAGMSLRGMTQDISAETKKALLAVPAGILFVDHTGTIILANQSAQTIFDVELEGLCWRDVIKTHFRPQKDDGFELSLVNGRKVKFSISKIDGTRGQLIHLTDLTETRTLQSKVAHMHRLSSLGKMVASLAHQLRTPLSAAMLYAANIANKNATESVRNRFVDKLSKRLKELESQINDMLLFAKSGGGSFLEEIAVQELLEELITESNEVFNTTKIQMGDSTSTKDVIVRGNRNALKGALQNLIQNAVAADASVISLALSCHKTECEIRVSDNGAGIPPKLKDQIFTPFFTTKSKGTGLGLAVVASVVKSHKGTTRVSIKDTGGTEFSLCLPLFEQDKEMTDKPSECMDVTTSETFDGKLVGEIA